MKMKMKKESHYLAIPTPVKYLDSASASAFFTTSIFSASALSA